MPTAIKFKPLAQVVGENCKAIRTRIGVTQDQLARHARLVGLKWSAAATADFEAGRASPTLATVAAVCAALQHALDATAERRGEKHSEAVTLADLLTFDGVVTVNDALSVSGDELSAWASGAQLHAPPQSSGLDDYVKAVSDQPGIVDYLQQRATKPPKRSLIQGAAATLARAGVAEYRVAKRLEISAEVLAALSYVLWGRTFSEERDHRAGPNANAQQRGQITRAMSQEISQQIGGGSDGDN